MVNDLQMPLGDVASIVGHSDIRVTEGYRVPSEDLVRTRLASLADAMFTEDRCFPEASGIVAVQADAHDR